MNFIEDTIFPHGSDSLGKECNIALKTSPKGSKTTFLPIKLQQSIIQAAMYAASASRFNYLIINVLYRNKLKLLAIIRLGYFLFLSFVYRIFRAFAYLFQSIVPRLSPKGHARDKFLCLDVTL